MACDLVYDGYEGEHYKVKHNTNHKWYYWPNHSRDKVILIRALIRKLVLVSSPFDYVRQNDAATPP